jgi:nucleoid-associated protein YgaU
MFGSGLDIEHPFGHPRPVARTRVRRRRLAAALLVVALAAFLTGPVAQAVGLRRPPPAIATTYVVRPGDTLWSIATRFRPGVDPRLVVDRIARANDLDAGALVPGQQVTVPAIG